MIRRVYKYRLPLNDKDETVSMPRCAKILTVQIQDGEPRIWALVDPSENVIVGRRLLVTVTGHDITWQDNMVHRGTFQLEDGALVFHLFEYI